MSEDTRPFAPVDFHPQTGGAAQAYIAPSVTVAATSGAATSSTPLLSYSGARQIRIANKSTGWAHIQLGTGTVQAATVANDFCVAPGSVDIITSTANIFSVILDAGTGNVIFTKGNGIK